MQYQVSDKEDKIQLTIDNNSIGWVCPYCGRIISNKEDKCTCAASQVN